MTVPREPPPKDLGKPGISTWEGVLGEFQLNSAELALLHQLCQTIDEIADIKAALADSAPLVTGSMGQPKLNPLLGQLVSHRKLLDQLTLALGLPLDGENVGRRRSPQAKQAADSRWHGRNRKGRLSSVQTPISRSQQTECEETA